MYDPLTEIPEATLRAVETQAREHLTGSAFPQLADALTEKCCETLRGMPGSSPTDVREGERLLALQLLTGRRSG